MGSTLISKWKSQRVICPRFIYQSLERDNKGGYVEEAGHDYGEPESEKDEEPRNQVSEEGFKSEEG